MLGDKANQEAILTAKDRHNNCRCWVGSTQLTWRADWKRQRLRQRLKNKVSKEHTVSSAPVDIIDGCSILLAISQNVDVI